MSGGKKWFVFYCDDYYEMGGVGWECFSSQDKALEFIESRMASKGTEGSLSNYQLIKGEMMSLVAVSHVTKIAVGDP